MAGLMAVLMAAPTEVSREVWMAVMLAELRVARLAELMEALTAVQMVVVTGG